MEDKKFIAFIKYAEKDGNIGFCYLGADGEMWDRDEDGIPLWLSKDYRDNIGFKIVDISLPVGNNKFK